MSKKKASTARRKARSAPPQGSAIRWVIVGEHGLYTGQYLTRADAIREHVGALFVVPSPKFPTKYAAWEYCRRKGDRAVKARVTWPNNKLTGAATKTEDGHHE